MPSANKERQKRTILQVIPALVSGGVERGTVEIAKKLKDSNFNSVVVSAGGPMADSLEASNISHIKLNVASKNPFTILKNARLLKDIIKEYDVDIVHARSRAPAWSCYMATKNTKAKFITTFHGIYNISGILKRFYNSIMLNGERIIAVSNFVKQHILENYKTREDKIRVIHRGADHRYFNQDNISNEQIIKFLAKYNIATSDPVILLPARMTSWKGHLTLIEAINKIKHLDFYCLIVGDLSNHPNFTQKVKNRIMELKLQSRVQIFGHESDMLSLYGISDIVLSTSIAPEAFGRVVIEAQSMEKLVIASNIGGAAETVVDKVTGYHVKPSDPEELAQKIEYCLSIVRSSEAQKVTKAARKSVIDKFSLDLMLSKTLELYEELI